MSCSCKIFPDKTPADKTKLPETKPPINKIIKDKTSMKKVPDKIAQCLHEQNPPTHNICGQTPFLKKQGTKLPVI